MTIDFNVEPEYRTNPLSHIPAVAVFKKANLVYNNIHYPTNYEKKVLENKLGYSLDELEDDYDYDVGNTRSSFDEEVEFYGGDPRDTTEVEKEQFIESQERDID